MSVAASKAPPHAPEAGWVRRLLGPFYITGVFWFRFHKFGVTILPDWAMRPLMVLFAGFFSVVLRNIRKAVAANLEAVLGPCGWWRRQQRIFRLIWTYSWCLSERYERLATDRRPEIRLDGIDRWNEIVATGRGFILLTAHLGSWEIGSMSPGAKERRRVHVVREGETDPKAQEFIRGLIEKAGDGHYVTHFAEDDPRLGIELLEALQAGEIVALQGDRPRSWGRPMERRLFGRPFPLPTGPAALARTSGAPLVPVFVFREGRLRYRCEVRPPIEVPATADRTADLTATLDRFARELERAIRQQPYQWFCFRKLW